MSEHHSPGPVEFRAAVEQMRAASFRPDLRVTEIPAPGGLAPSAYALAADVLPVDHGIDSILGTGRFVFLHDPEEPEPWAGPYRIICFAQAPLESEIGVDPFLAEVTWSWLLDALEAHGARHRAASGTATRLISTGFGELAGRDDSAQLELRASWSPLDADLTAHVEAWGDLLCLLAGLPPAADVVGLLPRLRAARD